MHERRGSWLIVVSPERAAEVHAVVVILRFDLAHAAFEIGEIIRRREIGVAEIVRRADGEEGVDGLRKTFKHDVLRSLKEGR
ncbi:protein of unknown function (plasmid) [Caballeronia sp. S22]